ncbi:hypothetical protein VUR80DRAFT_9528 [Thermomyces stellatus]
MGAGAGDYMTGRSVGDSDSNGGFSRRSRSRHRMELVSDTTRPLAMATQPSSVAYFHIRSSHWSPIGGCETHAPTRDGNGSRSSLDRKTDGRHSPLGVKRACSEPGGTAHHAPAAVLVWERASRVQDAMAASSHAGLRSEAALSCETRHRTSAR